MKVLKYTFWTFLSVAVLLLVGANLRHSRGRMVAQDLDFDERAIC